MICGEAGYANFDPVVSAEQAGRRPVVILSEDKIGTRRRRVIAVHFSAYRATRRLFRYGAVLPTGEGGLTADAIVLSDQICALRLARLRRRRG